MAFSTSNLVNIWSGPPGFGVYLYKSDTDTRETVMASGYFNNTDDDQNLVSDDVIIATGNAGFYTMRVDTVTAGVVTTELAGQAIWLSARIANVAITTSSWTLSPIDGVIGRMKVVLEGSVNVDTTFGLELGGTNVTDGGSAAIVTAATAGSAAGDVFVGEADAANVVSEGSSIEVTSGGEGSTTSAAYVLVEVIPA